MTHPTSLRVLRRDGFPDSIPREAIAMRAEELSQLHKAEPFRPFRIHLADGRHLDVEHPEFLAYTPKGRTAVLMRLDDTFEVIDLMLVTTLEVIDGRPRSRRKK